MDVLVGHPKLVSEGLDLLWFPTLAFYQLDSSVFTVRQASRRSWRIGQRQPVEVHFLVYAGTLQARALHLMASKLQASLAVEGELPEDGLAAGEAEEDFLLALAREAVGGADSHEGGLEALFADAARRAVDDAFLLPDGEEATEEPDGAAAEPPPAQVLSFEDFRRQMGLPALAQVSRVRRVTVPKEQLRLFG